MTALQVAYEAKEKEFSQSVSPDDKEESSRVSSELAKAEEKLAEANKQLLAYKKEIQELNESLAKQVCIIKYHNENAWISKKYVH